MRVRAQRSRAAAHAAPTAVAVSAALEAEALPILRRNNQAHFFIKKNRFNKV